MNSNDLGPNDLSPKNHFRRVLGAAIRLFSEPSDRVNEPSLEEVARVVRMDEAKVVEVYRSVQVDEAYIKARDQWLVKNVYQLVKKRAIGLAEKLEGVRKPTDIEIAEAADVSVEIVVKAQKALGINLEQYRENAERLTRNRTMYGGLAIPIVTSECWYAKSFVSWIEDRRDRFHEISRNHMGLAPEEIAAQRYSDLDGEGHKAFEIALRAYREGPLPFSPYAHAIVRNAVKRAVNGYMPRNLSRFLGEVSKATIALEQVLKREPSHEEIANYLSQPLAPVSVNDVSGAITAQAFFRPDQPPQLSRDADSDQFAASLELSDDGDAHDTRIDSGATTDDSDEGMEGIPSAKPARQFNGDLPEWLRRAIEELGDDFYFVASAYFDDRTDQDIAAAEGVKPGTVRQRRERAMDRLLHRFVEELLGEAPEIAALAAHYSLGAYRAVLADTAEELRGMRSLLQFAGTATLSDGDSLVFSAIEYRVLERRYIGSLRVRQGVAPTLEQLAIEFASMQQLVGAIRKQTKGNGQSPGKKSQLRHALTPEEELALRAFAKNGSQSPACHSALTMLSGLLRQDWFSNFGRYPLLISPKDEALLNFRPQDEPTDLRPVVSTILSAWDKGTE